jgi:hypothetical protein
VDGVDPEREERCVHRALQHCHQVRSSSISTRGLVQIGSGLDCTCRMTQRGRTAGRPPAWRGAAIVMELRPVEPTLSSVVRALVQTLPPVIGRSILG